ncbi:8-oxoguanine deaminase [Candidatus Acetothermia bacterium]|nr:8-oxoguanine deaminase [Candidatus Acetothermia bacterium]
MGQKTSQQTKQEKTLLIKDLDALVDLSTLEGYVRKASILIRGNRIAKVYASELPHVKADQTINGRGKIAIPGLINTHHHLYQTLTRAYAPAMNSGLFDWLIKLYPVWAKMDEDAIYWATLAGMAELMLSGCTLTTDHHYVFSGSLQRYIDIQIEAAREIGIRFHPCRGSMSLGKSKGGLPPDVITQPDDEILKDSERLIKEYHDALFGAMTRIALAPCSPFSVTRELMRETATLAKKHSVRLHTHLAETQDEEKFCEEKFGCSPLEYLEELKWSGPNTWLAHGIYFNSEEIQRMSRAGMSVAHCPTSNMRLGSGVAKVLEMRRKGVNVGLAVDGSASNDSSNMLVEVKQALLLQRVVHGPSALLAKEAIELATIGSAKCLGREDVGTLAESMAADIALFDLEELGYSGGCDPLGTLVLCGPTSVHTLIVNGKVVIKNHELLTFDVERIVRKHRAASAKLFRA